ncbi:MAG: DMT family transporter [Elusimicrobiota bacterium]|jgi:drug/metabolite transporter (DMT)-like permease|nr:DMT family transporter [Elusimicrobiota bacterium]
MNYVYFFLLAFCWGTAFVGVKYSVNTLDPYFSAFARVFIGFVFFTAWFLITKKKIFLPRKEAWRPWLAGWLIMGVPFIFLYWGQQFIPAGTSGIFNGTVPLWVFIIAALTLKGQDAFTWRKAAGVVLGLAGLFLVMSPAIAKFADGAGQGKMVLYGSLSVLFMAFCYGAGNVLTRYILTKNITLEQNIFQQHLFSAVFLFFVMILAGAKMPGKELLQPKLLFALFYVALVSSALALLLLFKLLKEWGALRASLATYVVPFIALGSDFLINGRVPTGYELAGMIIIILSLALIQFDRTNKPQTGAH